MLRRRSFVFGSVGVLGATASAVWLGDAASTATGGSPVGAWKTIDDRTGKTRSIVQIVQSGDVLRGRVVKLFDSHDANCTKCEGDKRNQPVLGLEILWGLAPDGDEWSGGKILDPEEGKVYRCKLWLEGADRLKVRGYWGPFFRTQIWRRDR